MSTIIEVITRVDENKPNAFTERQKVLWLAALDGRIAVDVFLMDITDAAQFRYTHPESLSTELLVSFPHDDIYELWLEAKIDFANGEYDKYQNTMEFYNAAYNSFVRWFASVYEPAQGWGCDCGVRKRCDVPTYYLTAYGLAVKQGFEGTLDEWLQSLVGADGAKVELRYENNAVQWRYEYEDVWHDLLDVADIQGKVIDQTLKTAMSAATTAQNARAAIEGMTVTAETLAPGSTATVEKTEVNGVARLTFGIPQGAQGHQGAQGPQGAQGVQGPPGPQGIAGVAVQTSGYVTFTVDDEGHLLCEYTGDDAPGYSIDENGHLILEY